jgi:cell division protein FtsB
MDEMASEAPKILQKFSFGCMSGDHTAYAMIEAKSADAVKAMLPKEQQDKAKIVKVNKFTAEEIKKMHSKM